MKYECEVIEDLLPLYKDGACSPASKLAVEEHLTECPKCAELFNALKDTSIDELIVMERDNVIESQSKFFKRKSALVGSIIAAVFAVPILVCLIVNLTSGHGLSWFFIVLAAMLIPTSLIVVPLMAPRNKMFLTMISFTASLIVLLAVCSIYTRGRWFWIAASGVLFGLTLVFSPFIACRRPVNTYLGNFKGLAVMAADTVTFFLMMLCIGLTIRSVGFFTMATAISVPLVAMVWAFFLIIRYLPTNGLVKTGVCIAALSCLSYYATKAAAFMALKNVGSEGVVVYSEPSLASVFVGVGIAAIFVVIGLFVGKKEKKND